MTLVMCIGVCSLRESVEEVTETGSLLPTSLTAATVRVYSVRGEREGMVREVAAPPTVRLPTRAPPLLTSIVTAVIGLRLVSQLREMVVSEEVTVSPLTLSGRPGAFRYVPL